MSKFGNNDHTNADKLLNLFNPKLAKEKEDWENYKKVQKNASKRIKKLIAPFRIPRRPSTYLGVLNIWNNFKLVNNPLVKNE